ncbi:MAG: hypothetical protein HQK51_10630 [Oligoflexia bacterium]|nr:hypothetical protein [Oligoflexia bacterium]
MAINLKDLNKKNNNKTIIPSIPIAGLEDSKMSARPWESFDIPSIPKEKPRTFRTLSAYNAFKRAQGREKENSGKSENKENKENSEIKEQIRIQPQIQQQLRSTIKQQKNLSHKKSANGLFSFVKYIVCEMLHLN